MHYFSVVPNKGNRLVFLVAGLWLVSDLLDLAKPPRLQTQWAGKIPGVRPPGVPHAPVSCRSVALLQRHHKTNLLDKNEVYSAVPYGWNRAAGFASRNDRHPALPNRCILKANGCAQVRTFGLAGHPC